MPLRPMLFLPTLPSPGLSLAKAGQNGHAPCVIDLPIRPGISSFRGFYRDFGMARTIYGRMADGTPVHAYTLAADGRLTATILDMGGTITAITVPDRDGRSRNVVLGLKDLAAYQASGWWNCLIGRYANRLKNGVSIAGQHYP